MANSFAGTNSLTGASSLIDQSKLAQQQANQKVNLGTIQDKGLASLLAQDTGAQAANSFSGGKVASLAALNDASANYSTVDESGWLGQYKNAIAPYLAARSSVNGNIGYARNTDLGNIDKQLTTTGAPTGYTQKQLDAMRYELLDPTGKSVATQYYGIDDVLRNQYRGRVGDVKASAYQAPQGFQDEYGGFSRIGQASPEELMWDKFLKDNPNAGQYKQGEKKLKPQYEMYSTLMRESLPDDMYDITPAKQAYNWGDQLYDSQEAANAARESLIQSRPGTYRNLMEKYEAAGEGGIDSQSWKGNYGGDNAFSGASAITQLDGHAFMKVDPRTDQWSTGGYRIDPNALTPEAMRDLGYTQYVEQGKQKKGGWKSALSGALTGGASFIAPKQFDPAPYEGKQVTEYGGNQVYRDYGSNGDALKALLQRDSSGNLVISNDNLDKIPEFYNKNIHDYNRQSKDVTLPNMAALRNMTIAGTIGDILFPEFTWGGGAAGSKALWATANKEATGQSAGDISKQALKNWGTGALTAYLGAQGADAGAAVGTSMADAGNAAQAAQYANYGAQAGKAVGSGLGSATGTAIQTGNMDGFGKNFGTGTLSNLIAAGLGNVGSGLSSVSGLDPRIAGALSKMAANAVGSKLRGNKTSNAGWTQMAINAALGSMRPTSNTSKYTEKA